MGVSGITEWEKHAAKSVNGQHSRSHPTYSSYKVHDKARELTSSVSQGPATSRQGHKDVVAKSHTEYKVCNENAHAEREAFINETADLDDCQNEHQINRHAL